MGRHIKRRPNRLWKPVILAATTFALAAGGTGTALASTNGGTHASSGTISAQLTAYTRHAPKPGKYNDDGATPTEFIPIPDGLSCALEGFGSDNPVVKIPYALFSALNDASRGKGLRDLYRDEIPGASCVESVTEARGPHSGIPHKPVPAWLKKAEQGSRNRLQG